MFLRASLSRLEGNPYSRRDAGLSILDVMIALMVLAILLAAISSSWFTLRSVQKLSIEENKVRELAQTLSERLIGASWDWLGRDRPDEMKTIKVPDPMDPNDRTKDISTDVVERYWRRCAWSWHRRETKASTTSTAVLLPPMTDHDWTAADYARFRADTVAPLTTADVDRTDPSIPVAQRINPHNLIDLGLIDGPTGLSNLQVYVEYYRAGMLDSLFLQNSNATTAYWRDVTSGNSDGALVMPESPFASDDLELQMNPADPLLNQQALVIRIIVTWGDHPKAHRHELVLARRK